MSEAVIDATVLIYLSKLDQLDTVEKEFEQVRVPSKVYGEVVEEGKELGERDAVKIEKKIKKGSFKVEEVKVPERVQKYGLEEGENSVLSVALGENIDKVLIDESPAREAARNLGLKPRGTLSFLLQKVGNGEIDFTGFLELMEDLSEEGFYINERLYTRAVCEARKISED